jgi:hypothetical protein
MYLLGYFHLSNFVIIYPIAHSPNHRPTSGAGKGMG